MLLTYFVSIIFQALRLNISARPWTTDDLEISYTRCFSQTIAVQLVIINIHAQMAELEGKERTLIYGMWTNIRILLH